MNEQTRAFLMVCRKVIIELLGALEDYLGIERSLMTSRQRYRNRRLSSDEKGRG